MSYGTVGTDSQKIPATNQGSHQSFAYAPYNTSGQLGHGAGFAMPPPFVPQTHFYAQQPYNTQVPYEQYWPAPVQTSFRPAPYAFGNGFSNDFLPGVSLAPTGLAIPPARYVRPPAMGRMAPVFAQTGAWQPSQTSMVDKRNVWPKPDRSASASPAAREHSRLAYLEGSDTMFPQINAASVRYQNLARSQPPDSNLVFDDKNVPFTLTAAENQPKKWGVVKIGNVSEA